MKKLSEVCKIVGITRRTLQEYDKIGLVKPSCKTESGYWLYDENAIANLALCKLLAEAGCRRSEIKQILNRPLSDLTQELSKVTKRLQEQQKRIEGIIHTISLCSDYLTSPDSMAEPSDHDLFGQLFQEMSFSACLDSLAEFSCELEHPEQLAEFWTHFIRIGDLKNESPASPTVQTYVKDFYSFLTGLIFPYQDSTEQQTEAMIDWFTDLVKECLDNPMTQKYLLLLYQQDFDSLDFINKSAEVFRETYHRNHP